MQRDMNCNVQDELILVTNECFTCVSHCQSDLEEVAKTQEKKVKKRQEELLFYKSYKVSYSCMPCYDDIAVEVFAFYRIRYFLRRQEE